MNPRGQQRDKPFRDALRKRIMEADGDVRRLDRIALALCVEAEGGDVGAIKEIGDRLDGKVPQALVGDSEHDPIAVTRIEREIIETKVIEAVPVNEEQCIRLMEGK